MKQGMTGLTRIWFDSNCASWARWCAKHNGWVMNVMANTMKCHSCGHSVGMYSGGYVWGRPYCMRCLPAEMATWKHLNRERGLPLPYAKMV